MVDSADIHNGRKQYDISCPHILMGIPACQCGDAHLGKADGKRLHSCSGNRGATAAAHAYDAVNFPLQLKFFYNATCSVTHYAHCHAAVCLSAQFNQLCSPANRNLASRNINGKSTFGFKYAHIHCLYRDIPAKQFFVQIRKLIPFGIERAHHQYALAHDLFSL